jgi:hypothetical protein
MLGGLEAQKEQELFEDQRRPAYYLDCCYIFWVVLRHRKNRSCADDGLMEGGGEVANQRAKASSRLRVAKVGSF